MNDESKNIIRLSHRNDSKFGPISKTSVVKVPKSHISKSLKVSDI